MTKTSFVNAAAIAGLGCLLVFNAGCGKGGGGRFAMPPMPVEVSTVSSRRVVDRFDGVGSIEALESITVVAEIDGAVKRLPFTEGGSIRKGGLIAQLDDAQLAAERARAAALAAQSKATYDRVKSVVDQGAAAPQDLDDASAALKVAEANLQLAQARYAKTRIVAPFDGIIGARKVSVGTFLRPGQAITELANIDAIRVTFSMPERLVAKLNTGAEVTVSTTAYPGLALKGTILVIEPVIDLTTRSARVVARVRNEGRKFRPGMSANVSAILGERPDALTIPSEAVFGSGTQSFVFIVKEDSTVTRVPLTLGTRMADVVEVVDGLHAGMTVVRAGHQKLFDGGKVMPIPSADTLQSGASSGRGESL
jgi:membrane fusion protein (multidrug efflux system)